MMTNERALGPTVEVKYRLSFCIILCCIEAVGWKRIVCRLENLSRSKIPTHRQVTTTNQLGKLGFEIKWITDLFIYRWSAHVCGNDSVMLCLNKTLFLLFMLSS